MATIRKVIELNAPAQKVWNALADFQNVHIRVASGFLLGSEPDGDHARVVHFANGTKAKEMLVTADAANRRPVYFIAANERVAHHNASAEVVAEGDHRCRFIWTTDVLPDAIAPYIDGQMSEGVRHMKLALEQ